LDAEEFGFIISAKIEIERLMPMATFDSQSDARASEYQPPVLTPLGNLHDMLASVGGSVDDGLAQTGQAEELQGGGGEMESGR
jgi:hypothetical protein